MNTDGLRAILDKDEIVPTRLARDLLEQPKEVDDLYKHHSRTYIPLQTGSDEASGVSAFSNKFIRQVKEARAPRGYITADFGYGKTSAGLYVWQQAQNSRLIAVPPFRLNRLEDLLDATAGWVAYILEKSAPTLVDRVFDVYRSYQSRDLSAIARRYGVTIEQAQQMHEDRTLQLNTSPADIVRFFAELTDLVVEAGFEGLVVVPDELQQYLEPEIKSGKVDPVGPLHEIVSDLLNQQGHLPFGFLMIITSKELGVINDQRGDIIDRMRGNTLDLRSIYDRDFPARLWSRFAETFDFKPIAGQLVDEFTLESLGQIASRQDLSNGPRTVINVFRRIAQRALDSELAASPYSPIDLIDDFLRNNIAFDGRKILQEVTNRALSSNVVRGRHELEKAVKLLAAFPSDGTNRETQNYYGLQGACSELKVGGSPEIVIEVGERHSPALALRGLDQARESTDELTLILGEFIRNYQPQAANQIERATNAFVSLLLNLVFKSENWTPSKVERRQFMRNAELMLDGAFPDMVRRFPDRRVYVRVLGDDEIAIESKSNAECSLTFVLQRHFDVSNPERQNILGNMELDEASYAANFELNLMLPCFDALNRLAQDHLRRVVDVEEVNVLMILALHEFLQNAAERDGVSKPLKEMIQRSLAIRLLEAALEVLLNAAVDTIFQVAGARIIEKTVEELIELRYGDSYHTLITYKQWRDRLRDYIAALNQLPSFAQKQGYAVVEGRKDEIAKYFGTTAASFDSFQSRFSDLIQIEEPFSRGSAGSVKFTRHPLEQMVFSLLDDSETTTNSNGKVRKTLRVDDIYETASELGYRKDEIEFILEIMEARDIIEVTDEWIVEKLHPDISPQIIHQQALELRQQAAMLVEANQQPDAKQMLMRAKQYLDRFEELDEHENEIELIILAEQVEADIALLKAVIEREVTLVRDTIAHLNLDAFDPGGTEILGTMILAGTFTAPINQIRVDYDQALERWRNSVSTFQENLAELKYEADELSIQSLQRIRIRVAQLKQEHLDLNDQRRWLTDAVGKIKIWKDIADLLHMLLGSIQNLGRPADRLLQELQSIENRIVQAFQQNAEETFQQPLRYHKQLIDLQSQLDKFASQAERDFNQLQEQYRALFIRNTGTSSDRLWQKIFYSSSNADGVYNNLYNALQRQVTNLLDNFFNNMEKCNDNLLALQNRSSETHGEREGIDTELNNLQHEIESIDDEYTQLAEQADSATIKNIENFRTWIEAYAHVSKRLQDISVLLHRLREQPQQPEISPQERALIDAISRVGSSGSLIRVRQEMSDLDDSTFWRTLRELWSRQIVELNIRYFDQSI